MGYLGKNISVAPKSFARRKLVFSLVSIAGSAILPLAPAWSQTNGCNVVSQLILKAQSSVKFPGTWLLSMDPLAISKARNDVKSLKKQIQGLSGIVSGNRKVQLLDYTEAVGGSLLLLSGLFIGSGPLMIANIAFSGSMLIVRAVNTPMDIRTKEVLVNVSGARIPSIVEVFSDGAAGVGVISKNAAKYGKAVGSITSAAFVVYGFIGFARSTKKFQASASQLEKLKSTLAELERKLAELEEQSALHEMRQACAQAILDDLRAVEVQSCPQALS